MLAGWQKASIAQQMEAIEEMDMAAKCKRKNGFMATATFFFSLYFSLFMLCALPSISVS